MLSGGSVLLLISCVAGEPGNLDLATISVQSVIAMAYLTIFGSMIALTAYVWLLRQTTASRVATYTYVNPVIAVFLGWLILGEIVSVGTALAVVVIVAAVVLIVTHKRSGKAS